MPDPVPAIAKVEDAILALLQAAPALTGQTIKILESEDVAIEDGEIPGITIYTVSYAFDVADEPWMTIHRAAMEFECVCGTQAAGTISRKNHTTIAHVLGALAADRTLGGMVQDIQETDVAPATPGGKDIGSASLQVEVTFYTPRDDWFTIKGISGTDF